MNWLVLHIKLIANFFDNQLSWVTFYEKKIQKKKKKKLKSEYFLVSLLRKQHICHLRHFSPFSDIL